MPLFVCENCNCIENTATGHYWRRNHVSFGDNHHLNGKALCSECEPLKFSDGSAAGTGKWHGKFPKETLEEFRTKWPLAEIKNEPK
jgi:hypothetical protein